MCSLSQVGDKNDSTTSLLPNIYFLSRAKCGELSEYIDTAHTEVEDLSSRYMNGSNVYDRYAGHDTNNFILPAPPVGGLPISQDWLDRMKLVHHRTVPIILPSGKHILAD